MSCVPSVEAPRRMRSTASLLELRQIVGEARERGDRIGLVPTMGALHAGHLSLVESARDECDFVVVTVFVNPTQFGPNEDFGRYPRMLDADLKACEAAGVDLVYHPESSSVYPPGFSTFVEVEGLSDVYEGAFRPGHFRGVATIVLKLLNSVLPDIAYFGRKDYQQQALIRRMCLDLDVPVEIRTCPTVREADGLALSSRNRYLSPPEREIALSLSRALNRAKERLISGESDVARVVEETRRELELTPGLTLDYFTIVHPDSLETLQTPLPEMVALVAARVGTTRLIDNLPIHL